MAARRGPRRSCRTRSWPGRTRGSGSTGPGMGRRQRWPRVCIDETGDVQPTRAALIAVRGTRSSYHNNAIQGWRIRSDGTVENVDV